MRKIIYQERMIELAFEGQRFWDVRRWKTAPALYGAFEGWNVEEGHSAAYHQPVVKYVQKFGSRDYFWPINTADIDCNPNLVQNLGW